METGVEVHPEEFNIPTSNSLLRLSFLGRREIELTSNVLFEMNSYNDFSEKWKTRVWMDTRKRDEMKDMTMEEKPGLTMLP